MRSQSDKPVLILCILFCTAQMQAQWLDRFDNVCSMSGWSDVQQTEGWNIQTLETVDISVTTPGSLTMMPYTVSWYADYRGPLLFRMAEGDFVFTTRITTTNRAADDIPGAAYSLGGMMIRNERHLTDGQNEWTPNGEDYVFLSIGRASDQHPTCPGCPAPHFEVKTTNNSNSNLQVSSLDTNVADIRMVRLHPYILVLYRLPGENWVVHQRYTRVDFNDTVQVGMVTYTDWNKVATYTMPFHNSHVLNEDLEPDPSSNPFVPFDPDIISRYDFAQLDTTSMPSAWVGLNLANPNHVSNAAILAIYGDPVDTPDELSSHLWLGRANDDWNNSENWWPHSVPDGTTNVILQPCDCPEASCAVSVDGLTHIGSLRVSENATFLIPSASVVEVENGLQNFGRIVVEGQLIIRPGETVSENFGEIDCLPGGVVIFEE